MTTDAQLLWLFILSIPVACVSWTVTHEEVLREVRERCVDCSKHMPKWYQRKFFYLFTCEYCLSHYVTAAFIAITRYKLLLPDWRGYLISLFAVVWVANIYMSIYNRVRLDIKEERVEIETKEAVQERRDKDTKAA